jgi:hypothetical protein
MLAVIAILTFVFHMKYNQKTVAYGPTILTTSGIFATFVGIAIGLSHFNTANIQASVPELLTGLKTAFWASVLGVGGALTLKMRDFFIGTPLRSDEAAAPDEVTAADLANHLVGIQRALAGTEDGSLISQIKLSRQDTNDRLDALKAAQIEALAKLSEMGSKALVEALRDVVKDFNSKITEQFGDNFKQLNSAVGLLLEWQEQYKGFLANTSQKLEAASSLMEKATRDYSQVVEKSEAFTKTAGDLQEMLNGLRTEKQQLMTVAEQLARLLQAASGSLPEVERKVLDLTTQLTNSVNESQKTLGAALTENAAVIRATIQSAGQEMATAHSEYKKHTSDLAAEAKGQILELTTQLAGAFNENQKIVGSALTELTTQLTNAVSENQKTVASALTENATAIKNSIQTTHQDLATVQTEYNRQIADMVGKTKEQVTVLDAALSEELQKSLQSLGRQLSALSEKFVSDYGPLTDKLRRLVSVAGAT